MDRRNFIKKSMFLFTGSVFVPATGIWRPSEAFWKFRTPSTGPISWATWTADSQASLADENIFVIFGDGIDDSNEIGQGWDLNAANATWTMNGAIPGSGTYRTLDGLNDWFAPTGAFRDKLSSLTKYGICFKIQNWDPTEDGETIWRWTGAATIDALVNSQLVAKNLYASINNNPIGDGTVDNVMDIDTTMYLYFGCDGADTVVGWCTSGSGPGGQPIYKSDFVAGNFEDEGAAIAMPNFGGEVNLSFFRRSEDGTKKCKLLWHWAVFCRNDSLVDFSK